MKLESPRTAGLLLFVAAAQFIVGMMVAEALHPGYSIADNFISDLGVGPAAGVFNGSIFLLGLLVVLAAFLGRAGFGRVFTILLLLTGFGAMGVGVFTEDAGAIHLVMAFIAFMFGGFSAIWTFRLTGPPFRYICIILGAIPLVALGLFGGGVHLGIGKGGMERVIAYPVLVWAVALGAVLMASPPSGSSSVAPASGPE